MNQSNAAALLDRAHEKATFDFKGEYDLGDLDKEDSRFEIAKDIAAFANHLGGTIVVGAVEHKPTGRLCSFRSVQNIKGLVEAIDQACGFCLPVPFAAHEEIELDVATQERVLRRSGATAPVVLLAINVQPTLNGPVGVKVWQKNKKGQSLDHAFRFPCRGDESTRFLRPEELVLAMNSHERRILIQLDRIGPGGSVSLWTPMPMSGGISTETECSIERIDHDGFVVVFKSQHQPPSLCAIPVALIRAIWRAGDGWNLAIEGSMLNTTQDRWTRFYPSIV